MSKGDNIKISTAQILSGTPLTQEQIKNISSLTAKQIYQQGFRDGYRESVVAAYNEAIEDAAILLRDTNRNGTDDVALVRKLKKE
jgi:hypothetical protein